MLREGGPGGAAGDAEGRYRDQGACGERVWDRVCTGSRVSLSCVSSMSGRVSPYQVPYLSTVGC